MRENGAGGWVDEWMRGWMDGWVVAYIYCMIVKEVTIVTTFSPNYCLAWLRCNLKHKFESPMLNYKLLEESQGEKEEEGRPE